MSLYRASERKRRPELISENLGPAASTKSLSDEELTLQKERPFLYEAFVAYDADGSGTLDMEELKAMMTKELCEPVDDADLNNAMATFDKDGSKEITFKEFVAFFDAKRGSKRSNSRWGKALRAQLKLKRKLRLARGRSTSILGRLSKRIAAPPPIAFDDPDANKAPESPYMIHPHSTIHVLWDALVAVLLLITLFTLPLSLAFDRINDSLFAANLIVDCAVILDVVKQFFTGFVDKNDDVDGAPAGRSLLLPRLVFL